MKNIHSYLLHKCFFVLIIFFFLFVGTQNGYAQGDIASIEITPANPTLEVGQNQLFKAQGYDQQGNPATVSDPHWETDANYGSFTVNPTDPTESTFTASQAGSGYITCYEGPPGQATIHGSTDITIQQGVSQLDRIDVTPSSVTLEVGQNQLFDAKGYDQQGNEVAITPNWSATGGTIDQTGEYTPTMAGEFTVTASVTGSSVTGTATVHINQVTPEARYGHTMVTISNDVYMFGGEGNGVGKSSTLMRGLVLNDFWRLEEAQSRWEQQLVDNPPEARHSHTAATLNGRMYVYGGEDAVGIKLNDVWEYDPSSNSWVQKYINAPPGARSNHTFAVAEGKIWSMGGKNSSGDLNDVWNYNPGFNTWEQKASMPSSLSGHTAVTYDEQIYVFGGSTNVLKYDPSQNSWQVLPIPYTATPPSRQDHIAVTDGEVMHVFGGEDSQGQELDDSWDYHFPTNTWIQKTSMPYVLTKSDAAITISQSGKLKTGTGQKVWFFGGLSDGTPIDNTLLYYPDGDGNWGSLASVEDIPDLPSQFRLSHNYPNPFNPTTLINYSLPNQSNVTITVYDMLGRKVHDLISYKQIAGNHTIEWNGRDNLDNLVSAGIYFYQIQAGDFVQTKKMVLLK